MKKAEIHKTPEEKLASNTEGVVSAVKKSNEKLDTVAKTIKDLIHTTKDKSIDMEGFTGVMNSVNKTKDSVSRKLDEVKSANLATNITLKKILEKPQKEVQKVELVNHKQDKEVQKVEVINHKEDKEVQKIEFVNKDAELAGAFFSLLKGKDGKDGRDGADAVVDEKKIIDTISKKIPKPKDGKDADEQEIIKSVLKQIPKPKDGSDGSPDTPDEIVEKINDAKKKIKAKQVEGLAELMRETHERDTMNQVGYSTGVGDISLLFFVQDLSSQCDGSNKTFTIPQNRMILSLSSTQFPLTYIPGTDFTVSGVSRETMTLTSQVGAPEAGQTLIVMGIRP